MRIIEYAPERRQDFIDLNVWWIERYFGDVERADWDEFDQIEDEIAKGGMVYFAIDEDDGSALATCAALNRGAGEWEIAKLGSAPDRPRRGYGKAVFEESVKWAEAHGANRIYILTNSSLSAAIHIYESHGFKRILTDDFGGFARGDYALEKMVERS